jgi:hypothetical protein
MGRPKNKRVYNYKYPERTLLKHNWLKHWKTVAYWAQEKYNLKRSDLDMIIFIYDEKLFTYYDFERFKSITTWDKGRFTRLQREGWISIYQKKNIWRKTPYVYEISFKGRKLVDRIYKLLSGEEDFPTSERRNPAMRRRSYSDKVFSTRMYEINKANQEQRSRQFLE